MRHSGYYLNINTEASMVEQATMTLEDAKQAHSDCEVVEVIDRWHDGIARPAIYVWATEERAENDDGAAAEAVYWLAEEVSR